MERPPLQQSAAEAAGSVRGADLHCVRPGPCQSRGPGVHGAGPEVRAEVVRGDIRGRLAGPDRTGLGASVPGAQPAGARRGGGEDPEPPR